MPRSGGSRGTAPVPFHEGTPRTQAEWEAAVKYLLDQGQAFRAHDLARGGLDAFPESIRLKQSLARALNTLGAHEEAREVLEPLCLDYETLHQIYQEMRLTVAPAGGEGPSQETLENLAHLVRVLGRTSVTPQSAAVLDQESLGLLGSVYKNLFRQSGNLKDARRCRDVYLRGFRAAPDAYWTGINAATLSWLLGDRDTAEALAREVRAICSRLLPATEGETRYWIAASLGEASLLLGDEAGAQSAYGAAYADYRSALEPAHRRHAHLASSLRQLSLMGRHGFPIPPALLELLRPPTVVLFAGHMIDHPDRPTPRFPPALEGAVREAIEQHLEELDACVGYSSAACGSDLIFIEAMLDRGAEVHIVLPFAAEDFIETSVRHAGPQWVRRFHRALHLADSVTYVTEERFLQDEILYSFAADVFYGAAALRARTLETHPYFLAVCSSQASLKQGGTAHSIARWPDPQRIRVVEIDHLTGTPVLIPTAFAAPPEAPQPDGRLIRTLMFADVVGYSQVPEELLSFFVSGFLERVSRQLVGTPDLVNTWGDAILAVMTSAKDLLEYALSLQHAICDTDWSYLGLPKELTVRIALHAGPVFEGWDPIVQRKNFYGSHVTRAARMEPVTLPGHIFASEQFVAMLMVEQLTAAGAAPNAESPYECRYVGSLELPKNYGTQRVYQLRMRTPEGEPDPR